MDRFSRNVLLFLFVYTSVLVGATVYVWTDYAEDQFNKYKQQILLKESYIPLTNYK